MPVTRLPSRWCRMAGLAGVAAIAACYVIAVHRLGQVPRADVSEEMQVALPRFIQVVLAGGDRYLAADVATFRALVASTEKMRSDNYAVQAQVQRDAAWLNPAHEDNYYVAAAILPWNGQFDAGQEVLARAMAARPWDWNPPFYFAFDLYHLKRQPVAAANVLLRAAPMVRSEQNRMAMEGLAYAWYERGYDTASALKMLELSAESARSGALKSYLVIRAARLRSLLQLQEAAARFAEKTGRPLHSLDELVTHGLIDRLPVDPFGVGYALNEKGEPVLRTAPAGR